MADYTQTVGAVQTTSSGAAMTVPMPAGTLTGQLILVCATYRAFAGATMTTSPSGYSLLASYGPSTDPRLYIWGKIGTSSESSVTVDFNGSDYATAVAVAYESTTGWPAIGSVLVGSTTGNSSTAGGSTRWIAHTMVASGNLALQLNVKPTTTSISGFTPTSGWTQASFATAGTSTSIAACSQYQKITGNASANTTTLSGDSATAAVSTLFVEFAPAANITVSVNDSTPEPTQAITITKTSGNWVGTPTATLGGVAMPALTSVGSNTAVLTLGAGDITNYDDSNATWELIRWNTALDLVVTDNSVQSNAVSITIQPPILDHFDQLAGGVFDYAPTGAADNDDCYVYIASGDGEGLPKIAGFQGNTVPSTVRFMVFDVSGAKWLACTTGDGIETFNTAQQLLSGDTADSFTETSDTALSSHTPDTDAVGNGWTIEADKTANPAPSAGTVMVIGATDRLTITGNTSGGSIDLGTTDMDVSWDVITGTSTGEEWTAYLRRVDGDNGVTVYVRRTTNMIRCVNRVSGVGTNLTNTLISGTNTPYTFANSTTYSFRAVVSGQDLNVYVNDVLVGTYVVPTTPAANATRFGLYSSVATPTYPIYFDNFNAVTGYVAPSATMTLGASTVAPGATFSGTASPAFAGTINKVYLADVPLGLTAATTSTFTARVMDVSEFDASGIAAAIRMGVPQVVRVTDGATELTTTVSVVWGVAANFGAAAGPFRHPPDGLVDGDDVLIEVVSGSGTADPITADFETTVQSRIIVRGFSVNTGLWLSALDLRLWPADAPVYRNEVKWSNGFGNAAYTKTALSTTWTTSVAGPTDTSGCWKLVESNTTAWHYLTVVNTIISGVAYTFQIKVKAAERPVVQLIPNGDYFPVAYANFNASTGQVSASSGMTSTSVEALADDWYLFTATITATSGASSGSICYVTIQDSSLDSRAATYAGDGASGIYIADLQLETGSTAHDYVPTEMVPLRSDQVIVRSVAQHNLLPYSNDLSNAAWTKTRSSISGSITLNSNASNGWGSAQIYKIVEDATASNTHLVNNTADAMSGNPAGIVTCRFIAQGDGTRNHLTARVYGDSASNYYQYTVNLTDGTTTSSTVTGTGALLSITTTLVDTVSTRPVYEVIVRGWPTTTSDTTIYQLMLLLHNGTSTTYNGDGASGVYVGKVQIVGGYTLPAYVETTTATTPFASTISSATINSVAAAVAKDAVIRSTEDQSNATYWTRTNIHAITAEGVSADGYPAYKVDCDVTDSTHSLAGNFQGTIADSSTWTVFADMKADERTWVKLSLRNKAGAFPGVYVNLSTGAKGTEAVTPTATEVESRGSGWYRVRVVAAVSTGGTTPGLVINISEADNDVNFAGLGADDGLLVSRCFAVEGNVAMADADAVYVKTGVTMEHVLDRARAIATMPGVDEFDDAGTHVSTRWRVGQDLALTDSVTTETSSISIEPYVMANFGTLASGFNGPKSPTGAEAGDDGYIRVLSGAGTVIPSSMTFVPSQNSTIRRMVYDVSGGAWLAYTQGNYYPEKGVVGGILASLRRGMI